MYGRRYQRKRGFKRTAVTLLALVMLLSVCFPGLRASAEDGNAENPSDPTAVVEKSVPETTAETVPEATAETIPETTGETIPETTQEETEPSNEDSISAGSVLGDLKKSLMSAFGQGTQTLAIGDTVTTVTIESGSSGTVSVSGYYSQFRARSGNRDASGFTISLSNGTLTISVAETVAEGTYTIQGQRNGGSYSTLAYVNVTSPTATGPIKVYVYVSSTDSNGNSWQDNTEFQELIGLTVCDSNGYFPAGVITLDASYLNGKTNANTPGAALINSNADWTQLLAALSGMDTTTLNGTYGVAWYSGESGNFSANRGNHVSEYLSQASDNKGEGWGSGKTALFRWHLDPVQNTSTASLGFDDQSVKYHLDLCFNTNKITFITGNNGITSGDAKDGTTVDSRVYISGSLIQEPRNLNIPDGYKFVGYYEDADFTIPWDGIGTPLNSDQTVYIKITPMENVVLHYVNVSGENAGSLSVDNEALNPRTGVAQGSTATAKDGYVFVGWYADKDCTESLSENPTYVPTKKAEDSWIDGTTYYAKFEQAKAALTIEKAFVGLEGNTPSVNFTIKNSNDEVVGTVTLDGTESTPYSATVELTAGTYTVVETAPDSTYGSYDYISTSYAVNNDESQAGHEAEVTLSAAGATVKFTNNYSRATAEVTVRKTVSGNMGDYSKAFTFKATLTDGVFPEPQNSEYQLNADKNEATFTLKHNQDITFKVPVGATFAVEETYYSPYTVTINETGGNSASAVITRAGVTYAYNNHYEAIVDTGVFTDTAPYIVLFSIAAVGAGVLLLKKRRYHGVY